MHRAARRTTFGATRSRHIAVVLFAGLLACATLAAQQTRLTDEQIKSAEAEVPRLVELLALKPGLSVADVGAGFGAWTMRLAREVGPSGRVYATDLGAPQLAALREIPKRERLDNVTVIEGAVSATNLPPGCCDAILVRDAYHHFTEPEAMIASLTASLKPGGRLAVIDFPPRPNSEIPAGVPANRRGHGVPSEIVEREVSGKLTHVQTIAEWSKTSQPTALFLVLFRKG